MSSGPKGKSPLLAIMLSRKSSKSEAEDSISAGVTPMSAMVPPVVKSFAIVGLL
jgi:hypothetical protein